jgi:hypothetical protein
MNQPIPLQGKWLQQIVSGYFNYHAVPTNSRALHAFRHSVAELWQRSLRRRSQRDGMSWERFTQLANELASQTENPSPLAGTAVRRQTPEVGAVCLNWARTALCGGRSVMGVSTAIRNQHHGSSILGIEDEREQSEKRRCRQTYGRSKRRSSRPFVSRAPTCGDDSVLAYADRFWRACVFFALVLLYRQTHAGEGLLLPLTRGATMWKLLFILAALVFALVSGATAIAVTTALQSQITIGSVILKPPNYSVAELPPSNVARFKHRLIFRIDHRPLKAMRRVQI